MKLLISTPCYNNQLDSRMVASVVNVIKEFFLRKESLNWDRPSSPLIAYNRNVSAYTAIKEDYDWLLFWDADISVEEPDFIFKMIDTAYKENADIVGLPVRLKTLAEKKYNCAVRKEDKYINYAGDFPKEPFSVDVIGTGIMLIRVEMLKKLTPPWFSFTETFHMGRVGFFPEDWFFCEQVKKIEGSIIADPRFTVAHYGTYPFQ